jgi:hypothetical protein
LSRVPLPLLSFQPASAKSVLACKFFGDARALSDSFFSSGSPDPDGDTVIAEVFHLMLEDDNSPIVSYDTLPAAWTTHDQKIVGSGGTSTARPANSVTIPNHGFTNLQLIWAKRKFVQTFRDYIGGVAAGQNESYYVEVIDVNTIRLHVGLTAGAIDPTKVVVIWDAGQTRDAGFRLMLINKKLHAHRSTEVAGPDRQVQTKRGIELFSRFPSEKWSECIPEFAGAGVEPWFTVDEAATKYLFFGWRMFAPAWCLGMNTAKNFLIQRYTNAFVQTVGLFMDRTTGQVGIGTSTVPTGVAVRVANITGGLLLPRWTTAARPTGLTATESGTVGYNTSNNNLDMWNGSTWVSVS